MTQALSIIEPRWQGIGQDMLLTGYLPASGGLEALDAALSGHHLPHLQPPAQQSNGTSPSSSAPDLSPRGKGRWRSQSDSNKVCKASLDIHQSPKLTPSQNSLYAGLIGKTGFANIDRVVTVLQSLPTSNLAGLRNWKTITITLLHAMYAAVNASWHMCRLYTFTKPGTSMELFPISPVIPSDFQRNQ